MRIPQAIPPGGSYFRAGAEDRTPPLGKTDREIHGRGWVMRAIILRADRGIKA